MVKESVNALKVKPSNFLERLEKIYIGQLTMKDLQELEKILVETYRLVERAYPEIDLNEAKQKSMLTRPTNNKQSL